MSSLMCNASSDTNTFVEDIVVTDPFVDFNATLDPPNGVTVNNVSATFDDVTNYNLGGASNPSWSTALFDLSGYDGTASNSTFTTGTAAARTLMGGQCVELEYTITFQTQDEFVGNRILAAGTGSDSSNQNGSFTIGGGSGGLGGGGPEPMDPSYSITKNAGTVVLDSNNDYKVT